MSSMTATMRILEPYPGIYAYYDGRIPGKRLHSDTENWLDDGAYSLGIAAYTLIAGTEALVYDTHMSLDHARAMRSHLEGMGVVRIRVVLSHWHNDHIAGSGVFSDCEIIALRLTADAMDANRASLRQDSPSIHPLVMPSRLFENRLDLTLGNRRIELHHFDIHSADGCVLWLPDDGILLAGDTVEDTVTYVSEAGNITIHIDELSRLSTWPIRWILPNHGDPGIIAAGGYDSSLIDANRSYLVKMLDAGQRTAHPSLADFIADDMAAGSVRYFEPYETVHRHNIAAIDRAMAAS